MKRKIARKKKPAGAKPARARPTRAKPGRKRTPTAARSRPPHAIRPERDFVDSLMIAGAEALGLTIDPAWRQGVKFNLRLVLDHAARVEAFSLPDDAEPAPVFHA
jgi:1-carboxybiuret hydrolase subunit AtzG-like protein